MTAMRSGIRLLASMLLVLGFGLSADAQQTSPTISVRNGTSDPTSCQPRSTNVFINRASTPVLKICTASNVWSAVGSIGGSTGATDNAVLRADGTGGSIIQSSLMSIDDSGGFAAPANSAVGTTASAVNGERLTVTQNGDQATVLRVSNSEAVGVSGRAKIEAASSVAAIQLNAHGTGRTATRAGVALADKSELLASAGGGLMIATVAGDVYLSAGGNVGMRLDSVGAHPSFPMSHKRVTAQFDKTSNTTPTLITGLSVNLIVAKTYQILATLATTSNSAGGIKFQLAGTATATSVWYDVRCTQTGFVTVGTSRATALSTVVGDVTAVTNATCTIIGAITVNAGGTLEVRFAQNASNAAASSVLVGSDLMVEEIQ